MTLHVCGCPQYAEVVAVRADMHSIELTHSRVADCPSQVTACVPGTAWVSALCACIPSPVIADPEFISVVYRQRTCPGGLVTRAAELERLRFCTVISGDLDLRHLAATDYSALHSIHTIQGAQPCVCVLRCARVCVCVGGGGGAFCAV
jgi:hypothetical protein